MNHFQKIKELQECLKKKNTLISLKKEGLSNTLRNGAYKKNSLKLDLSEFNQVLEINTKEEWIRIEPRMTFRQLCHYTLQRGYIPPVVPEFSTITVGGAIIGAALESSSHRFGQVNDCCLEYELLLGNGEVLTASPEENSDLFNALPGSYGTLAILTAVKMKILPAKKWVNLRYYPFKKNQEALKMLSEKHSSDFVEGIVFNKEHSVVILGEMCDAKKGVPFRQKHYWSPWYVQHVMETTHHEEYMKIEEYLFRLDRGAFWMGRYVHSFKTMLTLLLHLGIPKIKNHSLQPSWLFRFLFGWGFSSKKLYALWHNIPKPIAETLFFIHDFYIPLSQAEKTLTNFIDKVGIFPIWLCPIKGAFDSQYFSPHYGHSHFLNIGLYGIPKNQEPIPQLSAELEKEIIELGGRKMLYSFTYYDQESFSKIYFNERYNALRKKYHADEAFPTLYNKVTNKSPF